MIYECPQCRMPQEAGQRVCPQCHAEFDGPVPDDAIVPVTAALPGDSAAPLGIPAAAESVEAGPGLMDPSETAAPLSEEHAGAEPVSSQEAPAAAPPPLPADTASGPAPYLTPPSYAPPPYSPQPAAAPLPYSPPSYAPPPVGKLTRALLIAFPLVLVLVLGGVYLAGMLNTESDPVPEPPPAVQASAPAPPAPAPATTPVVLQGGGNTDDNSDPHAKLLTGRWVSKSDDFYVFNSDGSGSRGSALKPSADQSFLWGLVQNRLMIYGASNETLRFNVGPDNDTIFLAPGTGHYVQYSRAKS